MDRQTQYAFQEAYETDFLSSERFGYESLGLLAMDLLGTTTLVSGLGCIPTGPASLQVKIQPGRLYSVQNLEPTAWGLFNAIGGLAADTNADHNILKQGIYRDTTTLATMAAPGTAGQSINYLIEAAFSEVDAIPVSLPFVSSTPPYPAVAPNTLNTVRQDKVVITVKAGTAAATGSQTTPSVDANNVGLWVVTVANGQTQINSGNMSAYSGAPFITETLTQKISQTTGDARYLRAGVNARIQLTGNTSFYVLASGSDANNGLANTAGGAWLTIQHAMNVIQNTYDANGFQITLNVGAGSFLGCSFNGVLATSPANAPIINGVGPTTIITTAINVGQGNLAIQNMKFVCPADNATVSGGAGVLSIGAGVEFGACFGAHIYANTGTIFINNNYTISGNASCHYQVFNVGRLIVNGGLTCTLTGTPAFANGFLNLNTQSLWNCATAAIVYSGSATGARYAIDNQSLVQGTAGAANFFPGNVAGTNAGHGAIYN